jgi:hypothetical protein
LRGPERDKALADLRVVLVRGLRGALAGRVGSDFDPVAIEDFAQDALVKILRNLDSGGAPRPKARTVARSGPVSSGACNATPGIPERFRTRFMRSWRLASLRVR